MINLEEMKVLKKIADRQVVKKDELIRSMAPDNPDAIESLVKGLMAKNYITTISPVGSKCFIITRNGIQALNESQD